MNKLDEAIDVINNDNKTKGFAVEQITVIDEQLQGLKAAAEEAIVKNEEQDTTEHEWSKIHTLIFGQQLRNRLYPLFNIVGVPFEWNHSNGTFKEESEAFIDAVKVYTDKL